MIYIDLLCCWSFPNLTCFHLKIHYLFSEMAPRDSVNYSRITRSFKVIDGAVAQLSNFLSSVEASEFKLEKDTPFIEQLQTMVSCYRLGQIGLR